VSAESAKVVVTRRTVFQHLQVLDNGLSKLADLAEAAYGVEKQVLVPAEVAVKR
jgi:hypothetical protein